MSSKNVSAHNSTQANNLLKQQIESQKLEEEQKKQKLSEQEFEIIKEQSGMNWDAGAPKGL